MSISRQPPRPRLDRETIVRVALELLNESGLDGVTTRRIANRLGVRSPTLYWHVKNKQELLDLMAAAILFRAPPGFEPSGPWWVWMGELARGIRSNLLEYRDGARVVAGTKPNDGLGPTGVPELLQQMQAGGLDPVGAWHVLASLSRFALGWTLDEQTARSRGPEGSAVDFDAEFEFGLQALLEGLRVKLGA